MERQYLVVPTTFLNYQLLKNKFSCALAITKLFNYGTPVALPHAMHIANADDSV